MSKHSKWVQPVDILNAFKSIAGLAIPEVNKPSSESFLIAGWRSLVTRSVLQAGGEIAGSNPALASSCRQACWSRSTRLACQ